MEIGAILRSLPQVATSPFAFVAYVLVVAAWLIVALRVKRNKNLLDALEKVPLEQRLAALQAEMGNVSPPKGFTAQQWLRSRIHTYYFYAFLALYLAVALMFIIAVAARPPASPPLTIESLKNASYEVDGELVTLQNGLRKFGVSPSQEGYIIVQLVDWAFGDLDGDGNADAVVVLAFDWGGSGTFMYLVPVLNKSGNPQTYNPAVEIGDRGTFRSVIIKEKVVAAQVLLHGKDDALCCPTVLTTLNFRLHGQELKCIGKSCKQLDDEFK